MRGDLPIIIAYIRLIYYLLEEIPNSPVDITPNFSKSPRFTMAF